MSKTEAAYQRLRSAILDNELRPSASLKLADLRHTFDIGWTPLREALSRLEAEKLVNSATNKGFSVSEVSAAELEDLTRARVAVEVPMLLESMEKGDGAWEERIVTSHYRLARCSNVMDAPSEAALRDWNQKHRNFHEALLSGCTSQWLLGFYGQIQDQLLRHHLYLTLGPALLGNAANAAELAALKNVMSIETHTALMEAVLDRDVVRAKALMIDHAGFTLDVHRTTRA